MLSFSVVNDTIEARVRAGITSYCRQNGIGMPKNGCDTVTAWNIASAMEDLLYKHTDTLCITDQIRLRLERYEPTSKMVRFAIMWQGSANMYGLATEVYAKVGEFGVPTFITWETPEFLSVVTDMVNAGNENTGHWERLVHDRDAVTKWFLEQEASK